jgi:hypothetical protein
MTSVRENTKYFMNYNSAVILVFPTSVAAAVAVKSFILKQFAGYRNV